MKAKNLEVVFPFLKWWPLVNGRTLKADLIAGITGAVIVLPQGVAFAMIAGLPPIFGLYSAMVVTIVAALFGSSRHLVSGPTTPISLVVFSAISQQAVPGTPEFIDLVLVLTFLAGVFQLAFGLARLGRLVNFVSHTVVVGFTAGAALLIATSQLKHALGLSLATVSSFSQNWLKLLGNLGDTNLYALGIALFTLVTALVIKRISPRLPYMLIAMVGGSVLCLLLGGSDGGVVLVGEMPAQLPSFSWPPLDFRTMQNLVPNAFAVALLGLIEAVAIGRSIATKTHQRIDGNQEFIGQGLSNIVGSFFSCYAGSGSFTRSGVNHQIGAQTPLSAIFSALLLMGIVLFVAPLTAYLPIPAMAGIILLVSYNLIDFRHIRAILVASRRETTVMIMTFLATLLLHLEFAIYIGVVFSLMFFLDRTSKPKVTSVAPDPQHLRRKFVNTERKELDSCPQLELVRIDGSIFFGAADHVRDEVDKITGQGANNVLLIGGDINLIDVTGAEMLVQLSDRLKETGGHLYLCNLKKGVADFLNKGGYTGHIGAESFFADKSAAISGIYPQLDTSVCDSCEFRIFDECPKG